ncbi:MAG TPA: hypothetical protein VLA44_01280 [Clostridia bacterium]|nr:hypothetical protein [Clostridia bacterium]
MSLRDVLDQAAAALDGIEVAEDGSVLEWRHGGQPFAALDGNAAEFRLDPLVARAALRTPDTSPSTRGVDWVRFAPADLDAHGVDRAQAWFASARRRLAGS